jgi:hypothetical protein
VVTPIQIICFVYAHKKNVFHLLPSGAERILWKKKDKTGDIKTYIDSKRE